VLGSSPSPYFANPSFAKASLENRRDKSEDRSYERQALTPLPSPPLTGQAEGGEERWAAPTEVGEKSGQPHKIPPPEYFFDYNYSK